MRGNIQRKKVVILEHEPLTSRLKNAWMIDELINKGIDIQYWDLSSFTDKGLKYPNKINATYIKYIYTFNEFKDSLHRLDTSQYIFFVEIGDGWSSYKLYKELKRNKCFCVKYELYASVAYPQKLLFLKRLRLLFTRTGLYFKTFILFNKLTQFFQYNDILSPCKYRCRTVAVNHPDYELFRNSNIHKDNYFVFLDIYYPLHPDYTIYNGASKNPHTYWNTMNSFFDMVEQKCGKKIIIAAHPKSDYKVNTFGNREIIKGMTCELVKGSDGVIIHDSASINFAVLANKPLFMCFTKEQMKDIATCQSADAVSRFVGIKVHILDEIEENDIVFTSITSEFRERFKYNMLTSKETEFLNNSDIFVNYILSK